MTQMFFSIGTKIKVGTVEGNTGKKGAKQNKEYIITKISAVPQFYNAVDSKGKEFTIWWMINHKKPQLIGVKKSGVCRMTG